MAEIGRQMQIMGITGDSVYAQVRQYIERGMYVEARQQLNFVDRIREAVADKKGSSNESNNHD